MTAGQRAGRTALAALALLASGVVVGVVGDAPPAAAAPQPTRTVRVHVDDVSPSVVPRTTTRVPLRIQVTLTNLTDDAIPDVRISGFRGDPIGNQGALDDSLRDTTPPTDGLAVPTSSPLRVDLPAARSVTTTFATTISVLDDGRGLCQCKNSVYPVVISAAQDRTDGDVTLGSATTYVPSQVDPVKPVKVSWLWPLIDRPHRIASDSVFIDDELTSSVNGGRLDRNLQVLEGLGTDIPLTLVVDPELLDELEVMATGRYTVQLPGGTSTPTAGTGAAAATAWLDRFAAMLTQHPELQVSLTPYADPDLQTLARDHLTWSTSPPTDMSRRVTTALAGRAQSTDVAWPAGGAVGRRALDAMAASGVRTVVVDGSALSPSSSDGIPVALARLRTSSGTVSAVATSPAMQRQADAALVGNIDTDSTSGSASTAATAASSTGAALPQLIAEIAVRAVQNPDGATAAVITPSRYVDPDPQRAIRVLQNTSSNAYATPVAARTLRAELPTRTSSIRPAAADAAADRLPIDNVVAARTTSGSLPALSAMLERDSDAQPLLAGLARAPQRLSSSAWRTGTDAPFATGLGPQLATRVRDRVESLIDGVRIVTPAASSYTLGSNDSSLPVTIENTLPYTVDLELELAAQANLPGYTMGNIGTQRIAANSKQTVQVPSHLEGSGRIRVDASIAAPNGRSLGEPVLLYVRSTDFGTIGVVITVVAGGVLVLALLVRLVRRGQRLRRKSRERHARSASPAEPVSTGAGTSAGTGTP